MERTYETNFDLIRADFPLTNKKIYMNNGSVAPTPMSTIKAITDMFVKYSIEGPDSKIVNEFVTSLTNELRSRVATLIKCEPEEIIFTQSTTEGINYVRNGIQWKKGDSMVIRGGTHEHYANYLPWVQLSKEKGVDLIDLPIGDNGYFDIPDIEKAVSQRKTVSKRNNPNKPKLIALSHALYNSGAIMPVEEVGKITRENDILFCIDAAQTIGSIETDVNKIGCDFMAFPSFKWICGPLGLGILFCSKKAGEILKPQSIGSESATLSSDQKTLAYLEPPLKFQTGFRNFPALAGLEASVRYLLRLDITNIRKKNMKVANLLRSELDKIAGVKLYGPEDDKLRTSIVSFTATNKVSKTIVDKLEDTEIILAERDVGGGTKAVRASPHFFNSEEEAMRVIYQIKNIIK